MSLLECARGDCPNIMCDRYSHQYGYICESCFESLTLLQRGVSIEEFMESDPQGGQSDCYEEMDREFPLR